MLFISNISKQKFEAEKKQNLCLDMNLSTFATYRYTDTILFFIGAVKVLILITRMYFYYMHSWKNPQCISLGLTAIVACTHTQTRAANRYSMAPTCCAVEEHSRWFHSIITGFYGALFPHPLWCQYVWPTWVTRSILYVYNVQYVSFGNTKLQKPNMLPV